MVYHSIFTILKCDIQLYMCNLCVTQETHCGILLKGFICMSLYIRCISWFSMPRWSVVKWKCHNMASCSSLDNIAMFITKATAIVTNICHLLKDTSSGWKIKVTRNSHNLGFLLYSIWKCDLNSCYIKAYNNLIIIHSKYFPVQSNFPFMDNSFVQTTFFKLKRTLYHRVHSKFSLLALFK